MTFLLEEVMTIGDNFNDSPMLALAGLGNCLWAMHLKGLRKQQT